MASSMNTMVTHIFREGNYIADCLANIGINASNILYY
jgi:hypothetical protein